MALQIAQEFAAEHRYSKATMRALGQMRHAHAVVKRNIKDAIFTNLFDRPEILQRERGAKNAKHNRVRYGKLYSEPAQSTNLSPEWRSAANNCAPHNRCWSVRSAILLFVQTVPATLLWRFRQG